jgi:glucan biosynthesis protein C
MSSNISTSNRPERLYFIDNIRIFLTVLVILHHLMVIYSGNGSWMYNEERQDEITGALGAWFCAVNQAYFMGLFLFISAYFVPGAYDRKGLVRFLKDRLIRLGIPLVVYGWIIRPLWAYNLWHIRIPYWTWFTGDYFRYYSIIGGGPLWFIEVLLIFAILYAILRRIFSPHPIKPVREAPFPTDGWIILFALLLGIGTFLVRVRFRQGVSYVPLNLQFANFAQYISLFVLGLAAWRRNWIQNLPEKTGRRWSIVAVIIGLSFAPLALLLGLDKNTDLVEGGWHWQGLAAAWWESFLCISMCIGVIYIFRRYFNGHGPVASWLARNAYTAYLIHEPVITSVALSVMLVMIYPLLKFVLMGLFTVPLTFLLSALIRKIPFADRVL